MRPATAGDAAAVAGIYNHYIATSTATFDTQAKSVEDRAAWIESRLPHHPAVVATADGVVVGWGALSAYRDRPAWSPTAEIAVYVHPDSCGGGIGRLLVDHLLEQARSGPLHVVVSQVVTENTASMRLFERSGFVLAGTMREVGWKFDRRLDVALYQLMVD